MLQINQVKHILEAPQHLLNTSWWLAQVQRHAGCLPWEGKHNPTCVRFPDLVEGCFYQIPAGAQAKTSWLMLIPMHIPGSSSKLIIRLYESSCIETSGQIKLASCSLVLILFWLSHIVPIMPHAHWKKKHDQNKVDFASNWSGRQQSIKPAVILPLGKKKGVKIQENYSWNLYCGQWNRYNLWRA